MIYFWYLDHVIISARIVVIYYAYDFASIFLSLKPVFLISWFYQVKHEFDGYQNDFCLVELKKISYFCSCAHKVWAK